MKPSELRNPETVAVLFARASRLFREAVVKPMEPVEEPGGGAAASTTALAAPDAPEAGTEKAHDDGR